MPSFVFVCEDCGHKEEVVSMKQEGVEPPLCSQCQGKTQRGSSRPLTPKQTRKFDVEGHAKAISWSENLAQDLEERVVNHNREPLKRIVGNASDL